MKIALRKPRARAQSVNVRAADRTPAPGHDLPIIAFEETTAPQLDWDGLMRDGVQPALLVGGERRSHGRR